MINREKLPKVIRYGAFYLFYYEDKGITATRDGQPFYRISISGLESYGVHINPLGFFTGILTKDRFVVLFTTLNETRQYRAYCRKSEFKFVRESPDGFMLSEDLEFSISDMTLRRTEKLISSRHYATPFAENVDMDRFIIESTNSYSLLLKDGDKIVRSLNLPVPYQHVYTCEEFIILISNDEYYVMTASNVLIGEEMTLTQLISLLKTFTASETYYQWNTNSIDNKVLTITEPPLQTIDKYVIYPYFVYCLDDDSIHNVFYPILSASITSYGLALQTTEGIIFLTNCESRPLPVPRSLPGQTMFLNGSMVKSSTSLTLDLWLAEKIDLFEARKTLDFDQTVFILRYLTVHAPDFLQKFKELLNGASMAPIFAAIFRSLDDPEIDTFCEQLGISRFSVKNLLSKDQQGLLPSSQFS